MPAGVLVAWFVVLAGLGSYVAFTFPVWSPVDEGAHFAYVVHVAESRSLPTLHDPVPPVIWRVDDYDVPPPTPGGFGSQIYEAFQPPLYYLTAAPLYLAAPNARTAVFVLRLYSLVLTLAAFGVFAVLCHDVVGDRWPVAVSFGGVFLLMPGTMTRSVTVSNEPMLMLATVVAALAMWRMLARDSWAWALVAAAAVAAATLTRVSAAALVAVLVAALGLWLWRRRDRRTAGVAVGCLALVGALLAPWLAWNHATYGTLTADNQAKAIQQEVINPTHRDVTLLDAANGLSWVLDPTTPQEWGATAPLALPTWVRWYAVMALFVVPAMLLPARRRDRLRLAVVAAGPLLVALVTVVYLTAGQDWPAMLPRYLRDGALVWCVAAFVAWDGLGSRDRDGLGPGRADPRPLWSSAALRVVVGAVVAVAALWAFDIPHYLT